MVAEDAATIARMRITHWGALSIGATFIVGGAALVALIPGTWPIVGWVMLIFGVAITVAAIFSDEPSIAINETGAEPNVYVEFDAYLDEKTPDAPFVVHNDGPGAVHDVQISSLEFDLKAMSFELIPSIRDGGESIPRKMILDPQGHVSERYSTMLSFVRGRLVPRNFERFIQDRIKGEWSRLGDFADVVIPFKVTFRRPDGRAGVRSHQLIFEPGPTRRAYVRALVDKGQPEAKITTVT
jgi:hypothetical protein